MRNKHKGTSLIEMITFVAIFAVIMIPLAHLFSSIVAGIPNSYKLYQLNTSLLNAVQTLRNDVAKAEDFILQDGATAKTWTLKLKGRSTQTSYTFAQGLLHRQGDENDRTWKLPNVILELKAFLSEPDTNAVELHSYISSKEYGKERKKLENNYLFYLGQWKEPPGGTL